MKTRTPIPCLVILAAGAAWFSPERAGDDNAPAAGTKADEPSPSCAELDEPCATNGGCCDFDETPQSGSALCVNSSEEARCLEVCIASADCGSGCCGQLDGVTDYGACMDDAVCPDFEFGGFSTDRCLAGVETFCTCGDTLGVPCDDRAGIEAACREGQSVVTEIFDCFAEYTPDACTAALETCG